MLFSQMRIYLPFCIDMCYILAFLHILLCVHVHIVVFEPFLSFFYLSTIYCTFLIFSTINSTLYFLIILFLLFSHLYIFSFVMFTHIFVILISRLFMFDLIYISTKALYIVLCQADKIFLTYRLLTTE